MGMGQSKPRSRAHTNLRRIWQQDEERRRSMSPSTRASTSETAGTEPVSPFPVPRPVHSRQQTGFSLSSATAVLSEDSAMALNAKVGPALASHHGARRADSPGRASHRLLRHR